jgi:hypothetical protein
MASTVGLVSYKCKSGGGEGAAAVEGHRTLSSRWFRLRSVVN